MMAANFRFVDDVVARRDLVITHAVAHACRLEPRESGLAWYCDLDDGTPTGESDPASFVRWVCPALRTSGPGTEANVPVLDVRRQGPHSDLGKIVNRLAGLLGRPAAAEAGGFVYTDPAGVLDGELRRRIENWPPAPHGDGVVRPAGLWSLTRTGEGLVVESVSWWDSAPALDHQIGLALEVAGRLTSQRR